MLRLAVIVLLLANGGYYAWTQGLLREWGYAPQEQAEPQRLQQQIRPETLQILRVNPGKPGGAAAPGATPAPSAAAGPSAALSSASAAPATAPAANTAAASQSAPSPGECLQAGVFDERQAEAVRAAAATLPANSWLLEPTPVPGRWMVYMGRFDDIETLERKRAELRGRKIDHDRAGGTLEYGLSLGRFTSREAAERELANLSNNRGVRTARVLQERPESTGFTLRLPSVTEALRPQLEVLRSAMAGRTLRSCG